MRIAYIGVSHWHLPLYLDPVVDSSEHTVVAVADPDAAVARAVADRIGTRAFGDWRDMCADTAPDFVFVLGRHIDMPEVCRFLIEQDIPFAVEKPAGVDVASVEQLASMATSVGAFAAVPFVFRQSQMMDLIADVAGSDEMLYLAFKFMAGPIDRYRGGSEWMLDRRLSGGGCLANLGVHFLDLTRLLLGPEVEVVASVISNALDGLAVEDHAAVVLRTPRATSIIETGYIYPAPHMTFDMHFSVRTRRHHFAAKDGSGVQVITDGGEPVFHRMPMSNVEYYPVFVRDVLERVQEGRPPLADLRDMAATASLLQRAYALSPMSASD